MRRTTTLRLEDAGVLSKHLLHSRWSDPHPPLRGTFSLEEKVRTLSRPRERVAEGRVRGGWHEAEQSRRRACKSRSRRSYFVSEQS